MKMWMRCALASFEIVLLRRSQHFGTGKDTKCRLTILIQSTHTANSCWSVAQLICDMNERKKRPNTVTLANFFKVESSVFWEKAGVFRYRHAGVLLQMSRFNLHLDKFMLLCNMCVQTIKALLFPNQNLNVNCAKYWSWLNLCLCVNYDQKGRISGAPQLITREPILLLFICGYIISG